MQINKSAIPLFVSQLRQRLATTPLPGEEAQFVMAHLGRERKLALDQTVMANAYRSAAVAVLIFAEGDQKETDTATLRVALIKRTAHPRDVHSGQVSFPGGSVDQADTSHEMAALRELHEEIGVPPTHVEVLGALTQLPIPVSKFIVYPFVLIATQPMHFVPQPGEVVEVLMPELGFFLDRQNKKQKDLTVQHGFVLPDVPYFDVQGHTVWGATAMILAELKATIEQATA